MGRSIVGGLVLVVCVVFAAACSSTSNSSGHTGTRQRGEGCSVDNDCAQNDSVCLPGQKVCTGALDGDALMTECDSTTVGACSGFECAVLNANAQGKKGICTLGCTSDASCGGAGLCITGAGGSSVCLKACTTDTDCHNGFVCVKDAASGHSVCFVN